MRWTARRRTSKQALMALFSMSLLITFLFGAGFRSCVSAIDRPPHRTESVPPARERVPAVAG